MITEEIDRRWIVNFLVRSDVLQKEYRRHRRYIFMTKSNIGLNKSGITGFDCFNANFILRKVSHVMTGEDFLSNRHRAFLCFNFWNESFALQSRDVEIEKTAVFNNLSGDFVCSASEFFQRNLFAVFYPFDQIKIRGSQDSQIL